MKGLFTLTGVLIAGLASPSDAFSALHQPLDFQLLANSCPSTPLLTDSTCQSTSSPSTSTSPSPSPPTTPQEQKQNQTQQTPPEWRGGTQCIGPYCLYSNRGFAHNRGIVLLTTAPAFAHLKTTFAASPPPLPPPESLFHAVDIPGKGVGLVANATIPTGTPLLSHPPVLLIHRTFFERPPATAQTSSLYDQIPALLPAATRRALLRQMGGALQRIIATNAFQVDIDAGGPLDKAHAHHFGVFPEISRLNHDCRPNAAAWTGSTDLVHRAVAVRDVRPGEELSISYVDVLAPRAERRARMQGSWGFQCGCERCAHGAESDARLARIRALEARLGDIGAKVAVEDVETYLRLMREEGLDGKMAGAYTTAALNYSLFGKQGLAVKHAQLAVEHGLREEGPDAADVVAMRELMQAPKEHFTWRGRVR
ncbi:hypothetical protein ACHAQA_009531 [Verticillium albo-atrum]